MAVVDLGIRTPADAIRRAATLHGPEIQARRRKTAQAVLHAAVAEQETPQARRIVETFSGLGNRATAQNLFDTVRESGLPLVLYARGAAYVEPGRERAEVIEQWQNEVLSGIGQAYIQGCMDFGTGTTVIAPVVTAEACHRILPDAGKDVTAPHGLLMKDGKIFAGVLYEFSPSRKEIEKHWRDFRSYAEAFGDLCEDNPPLLVVTPSIDKRLLPGIASLAHVPLPATAYEIQAYANILFDVIRPEQDGQTLAEKFEFGTAKSAYRRT